MGVIREGEGRRRGGESLGRERKGGEWESHMEGSGKRSKCNIFKIWITLPFVVFVWVLDNEQGGHSI